MKFTLRLITVICYFLPCTFFLTTCNGLELKIAYNQKEADKNVLDEKEFSAAQVDTVQSSTQALRDTNKAAISEADTLNDKIKIVADTPTNYNLRDRILKSIIMPTDTSLSGIGSILYFKNMAGKIAIGVSLVVSMILLIAFRLLKLQKTKRYLLMTAVLCVVIFIIDSLLSQVTLLYGIWVLLMLLCLQLFVENKDQPVTTI